MALITLDPEAIFEYIPKFDRKNSVDPLIVKLTYMCHGEYLDYIAAMAREMGTTNDPEKQTRISKAHDKKSFCKHVKGFENWTKRDGTQGSNEVEEFYDTNDKGLIYEIQTAIEDSAALTAGQRKN